MKAGNEYNVLTKMSIEDIALITNEKLGLAIKAIRENRVVFKPGYDGVYGEIIYPEYRSRIRLVRKELLKNSCKNLLTLNLILRKF